MSASIFAFTPVTRSSLATENSMSADTPIKDDKYILRLYVVDNTPKSILAEHNLRQLCAEHLAGRCHIEIIDLLKNPKLAQDDEILAVPTLVRELPVPIRKFIGTLSDPHRVLVDFDLRPNEGNVVTTREGNGHAP